MLCGADVIFILGETTKVVDTAAIDFLYAITVK